MISGDGQPEKAGPDDLPRPPGSGSTAEPARSAGGPFVGVVVNRPIDQVLTYRVPDAAGRRSSSGASGSRCRWDGATSWRSAIAWRSTSPAPEGFDPRKLKDVAEILDPVPLIDDRMLELTRWMAEYYVCSWGQALDTAVPAGVRNQAGTRVGTFLLVPEEVRQALKDQTLKPRLSPKQAAALEVLCRSRRAADDLRRLPAGQVRQRPGAGTPPPEPRPLGPPPAVVRPRGCDAGAQGFVRDRRWRERDGRPEPGRESGQAFAAGPDGRAGHGAGRAGAGALRRIGSPRS